MKHAVVFEDMKRGPISQTSTRPVASVGKIALGVLPMAVLLSACGSGGGDGSNPVKPIVQIGMQRLYEGTATRAVVYANPTASLPNNTLAYTFTQNQTVQQAPTGISADFDVHTDYAYTVTQDPGVGVVPVSQSTDTYENLAISGNDQTVTSLGSVTTSVSNDETSNQLGNGPYTETSTTTATFTTPRDNFTYPLQTGATMTVPQSATETIVFTDVNGSGAAPTNGSNVGYTITRSENNDGSFDYQTAYVNGTSFSRTQNADGSGTQLYVGATSSTNTTVGLPALVSGANTIPVTVTVEGANTTNYSAADWYPNNGAPSSPLVLQTRNVVGPTSTLPADCNGAVLRPDIYEVDTTTTNLNPIGGSYATTTTRNFVSGDAVSICQLSTETASSYRLDTGDLVSTTTTTTTTLLNSINY